MTRVAFKMHLRPGYKEEYKKRHAEIWPELKELLSENGIREYSIFFDEESNTLFAFQKLDGNATSQELADQPIIKKWWNYMADIMEVNPDMSPISKDLEEVFYMD